MCVTMLCSVQICPAGLVKMVDKTEDLMLLFHVMCVCGDGSSGGCVFYETGCCPPSTTVYDVRCVASCSRRNYLCQCTHINTHSMGSTFVFDRIDATPLVLLPNSDFHFLGILFPSASTCNPFLHIVMNINMYIYSIFLHPGTSGPSCKIYNNYSFLFPSHLPPFRR